MFINHIYMLYISAKGFAILTFNWADIVKNINFNENALKSTYFEKVIFFNICQEINLVILSYKLCGRQAFSLPEIDFWMIFLLCQLWALEWKEVGRVVWKIWQEVQVLLGMKDRDKSYLCYILYFWR